MTMEKTEWKLGKHNGSIGAFKGDKLEAYGFRDNESALKAVHVKEGSPEDAFFIESAGVVYRKTVIKVGV